MLIAIPLFDRFTALDAVGPYEVLQRLPGAEVVFCATEAGPVRTDTRSLAITADRSLREIDACDILVVPGGYGTREAVNDEQLVGWIRRIHDTTTWTTSVCTGALLLGAAGLLKGLKATTHWAYYDNLAAFGATPTEQRVVEQGKIVTAGERVIGHRHGSHPGGARRRRRHRQGHPAGHGVRPAASVRLGRSVQGFA